MRPRSPQPLPKSRAVVAADHRARTPHLELRMFASAEGGDQATYRIRNNGPQALDSLVVPAPVTTDRIVHQVGTNKSGWRDSVEIGPLPMGEAREFKLDVGAATAAEYGVYGHWMSEISVVLACAAGEEKWPIVMGLPHPRPDLDTASQ